MDNNCCGGLECKMAASRQGVDYTCQVSVGADSPERTEGEDENEDEDVKWTVAAGSEDEDESANSMLREVYRTRLERAQLQDRKLLKDSRYLIEELQKPLTFDEMKELQQIKELNDFHKESELRELREWKKNKDLEEENMVKRRKKMEEVAKERVDKVLKEEERQKLEMLQRLQKGIKDKHTN